MRNKSIYLLAMSAVLSSSAFAYNIYNNTEHSVQVKDKSGFGGIDVTMPPKSSSACNPKSHGCHGKLSFAVYAPQARGRIICTWDGKINKDQGNYFVITPVAGKQPTEPGACFVEYYHE